MEVIVPTEWLDQVLHVLVQDHPAIEKPVRLRPSEHLFVDRDRSFLSYRGQLEPLAQVH